MTRSNARDEAVVITEAIEAPVTSRETYLGLTARWLLTASLLAITIPVVLAQSPLSREYIRLGGRVVAIENPTPSATAQFVATDTGTQGNWKGRYGTDGYTVVSDSAITPPYGTVTPNGAASYTWVFSTSDIRGLQKAAGTDRIAATWYQYPVFTVDVNLTDGKSHQVALYCLDWDSTGRSQTINILDFQSGTVLDTRSVSGFNGGKYVIWNITGHVTVRVTMTGTLNAVISGVFFDTPGVPIVLTPASVASLGPNGTQQFTATLNGQSLSPASWTLNPLLGTIASGGLYTAPSTIPSQQTVIVSAATSANLGTASVTLVPPSSAQVVSIFGTGVDSGHNPLPDGSVDPHYALSASADAGFPGPNAYVVNSAWPIPPWIAQGPNSKWIAPQRDQSGGNAAGNYTYHTTFDLTGMNLTNVSLNGRFASDNSTTIKLNTATVVLSTPGFTAFTPFTINSGFLPGVNSLDFVVNNAGTSANPTGLRVDVSGSASGSSVAFTPSSSSFLGGGGADRIVVTATAGVPWFATSNSSWITITSGGSGSGAGTVNYSVDINSSGASRSGTVTINGQTFSVTQSALVAGGPSNVSVVPSSTPTPNPGPVTFTFTASDPNGYAYIDWVQAIYNWAQDGSHGCYVYYDRSSNSMYLMNDASSVWLGPATPGMAGQVLQNSQCSFDVGSSQVSGSGTNLILSVALSFKPLFLGPQNIYMDVGDHAGNQSGWLPQLGTWTGYAASSQLPTSSVVPNTGSGMTATLTFHSNDVNGWGYIPMEQVLINSALDATHACYFIYYPNWNALYLLNDTGSSWGNGVNPGSSGTLSNSQCSLDASQMTFGHASSTDLTLTVPFTFTTAFQGQKNIYAIVYDHAVQTSGWSTAGTWNVTPAVAVSVLPHTAIIGPTGTQQFTATVTGTSNTAVTWSMVAPALGAVSSTGLYQAPSSFPGSPTDTVKATSVADTAQSGTAAVSLVPPSITFSPSTLPTIPYAGATGSFSITSTTSWTLTANDGSAWLTVTPASGAAGTTTVTYTATASPLASPQVTQRTAHLVFNSSPYNITQDLQAWILITPSHVYDLLPGETVQLNAYLNGGTTIINSSVNWTSVRADGLLPAATFSTTTPGLFIAPNSPPPSATDITVTATLGSAHGTASILFSFFPIPSGFAGNYGGGSGVGNTFTYPWGRGGNPPNSPGAPPSHLSMFFSRDGLTVANSCFMDEYPNTGGFFSLTDDSGSGLAGPSAPLPFMSNASPPVFTGASTYTLQNSQCEVYYEASARQLTNYYLYVYLGINFNPSTFSGVLQQKVRNADDAGNPWIRMGDWTVPTPTTHAPSLVVNALPTPVSGAVNITGWALDNLTSSESAIRKVEIYLEGRLVGQATYGLPSTACNSAPGRPGCPNVGFSFPWDTTATPNGTRTIRVVVTDNDSPNNLFTFTTITPTVQN